jgi:hypothetical protein
VLLWYRLRAPGQVTIELGKEFLGRTELAFIGDVIQVFIILCIQIDLVPLFQAADNQATRLLGLVPPKYAACILTKVVH